MVPRRRRRHSRQRHPPSPPSFSEERKSSDENDIRWAASPDERHTPPHSPVALRAHKGHGGHDDKGNDSHDVNGGDEYAIDTADVDMTDGKACNDEEECDDDDEDDDDDEAEEEEMLRLRNHLRELRHRRAVLEDRLKHAQDEGTEDTKKEQEGIFSVSKDVCVFGTSQSATGGGSISSFRRSMLQKYSQLPYIHPLDKVRIEHSIQPTRQQQPRQQRQQQQQSTRGQDGSKHLDWKDTGKERLPNIDLVALSRSLTGISMDWITSTVDPPIPILPMQDPRDANDVVWKLHPPSSSSSSSSTTAGEEREQVLRVQFHVALPTTRKPPHYTVFFDVVERDVPSSSSSSSVQQPAKRRRRNIAWYEKGPHDDDDDVHACGTTQRRTFLRCVRHTMPSKGVAVDLILTRHGFDVHRMLELDQWTREEEEEEEEEEVHDDDAEKDKKRSSPRLKGSSSSRRCGKTPPQEEPNGKRAPPLAWHAASATAVLNQLRRCIVDLYNACYCFEQRRAACRFLASKQEQTDKFLSHLLLVAKGNQSNNPNHPTALSEANGKQPIVLLQSVSYDDAYTRISFDVTTTMPPPPPPTTVRPNNSQERSFRSAAASTSLHSIQTHPHADSSTCLLPPMKVELDFEEPLGCQPTKIYGTRTTSPCTPESWGGVKVCSEAEDYFNYDDDEGTQDHQWIATLCDLFREQSIPRALPTLCSMLVQEWRRKEGFA